VRIHRVRRAAWGEKLLFYDIVAGEKEVKSNRRGRHHSLTTSTGVVGQ
jgi:hypothetical protein